MTPRGAWTAALCVLVAAAALTAAPSGGVAAAQATGAELPPIRQGPTPAPGRSETPLGPSGPRRPDPVAPLREGDPILDATDRGDPVEPVETIAGVGAVIRTLDKFTGERSTLEIPIDSETSFRRMRIVLRACYARVSARDAEATAFVQIFDARPQTRGGEAEAEEERVFSGWMFSSSPALSALDHPRYDVWVLSCMTS